MATGKRQRQKLSMKFKKRLKCSFQAANSLAKAALYMRPIMGDHGELFISSYPASCTCCTICVITAPSGKQWSFRDDIREVL
jgi:hypothetical protein